MECYLGAAERHTDLNGFNCIVFVQFVDVIGDAGVKRCSRNGMDHCCIMGLLLISLTVCVDEQSDQTAENGAAQAHSDHVEHIEVCEENQSRWRIKSECRINPAQKSRNMKHCTVSLIHKEVILLTTHYKT